VDLLELTFRSTPPGTDEASRVGFEKVDFRSHARNRPETFSPFDNYYFEADWPMHPVAEAMLLARAAARRGHFDEVNILWNAKGSTKEAREHLACGIFNKLMIDVADPAITWERQLELHQLWLESFPGTSYFRRVTAQSKILESMTREGVVAESKPTQQKTRRELQIEGWVQSLRDESVHCEELLWVADGQFIGSPMRNGRTLGPASQQLLRAGSSAAGALIDAVDNETLTHCVWYSSRHGGGIHALSVGELADALLHKITGLQMYGSTRERKAKWQEWWKIVRERGEEEALVAIVLNPATRSQESLDKLLTRFPNRISDACAAVRNETNRGVRVGLLQIVDERAGAQGIPFLIEEIANGPYLHGRIEAARLLLKRGDDRGLDSFVKKWQSGSGFEETPDPNYPGSADSSISDGNEDAAEALLDLVLTSNRADAIAALAPGFMKRPERFRKAFLFAIERHGREAIDAANNTAKKTIEDCLQSMLVDLLDDTNVHFAEEDLIVDGKYARQKTVRAADRAARMLHELFPSVYPYEAFHPRVDRDRNIVEIKNVWRKTHGMELLPVPPVAPTEPGPESRSK
jgi:hypothetical protein